MLFRGPYAFLSNMYLSPIVGRDGKVYRSAEHAFQACKAEHKEDAERIRCASSPAEAKRMGRTVPLRVGWEDMKEDVMFRILLAKFSQNAELGKRLSALRGPITEENTWGDTYWGVCRGVGQNRLGALLEAVRDLL